MAKFGDTPYTEQLEITPQLLERLTRLSGNGMTKADIAGCLCITDKTLDKLIKKHIKVRMAIAEGRYSRYENATGLLQGLIDQGNAGAIMFFLKTRWTWRERDKQDTDSSLQSDKKSDKIDFKSMSSTEAARVYQQIMKGG